ncbi:hypothetical protein LZ32DRAFT_408633 [Colletotrichum eremochloae]|nr:hypothetical protein LZ32DRAFT_408633 [Colletotrichum eremochloae]
MQRQAHHVNQPATLPLVVVMVAAQNQRSVRAAVTEPVLCASGGDRVLLQALACVVTTSQTGLTKRCKIYSPLRLHLGCEVVGYGDPIQRRLDASRRRACFEKASNKGLVGCQYVSMGENVCNGSKDCHVRGRDSRCCRVTPMPVVDRDKLTWTWRGKGGRTEEWMVTL